MLKFNEHILLVLRWLQNKNTVSKVELKNNSDSAIEIYHAAADAAAEAAHFARYAAAAARADAKAAARADAAATYAAAGAATAAAIAAASGAEIWLNKTKKRLNAYFKLTKEDRQAYEERAKYLNVLGANNA